MDGGRKAEGSSCVEVEVVEVEKQEEEGLMKVKDESRFFP